MTLSPILQAYDEKACARFERTIDREENDEVFLAAIKASFAALVACDNTDGAAPIQLELLNPYSRSDVDHRIPEERLAQQLAVEMGKRKDLFAQRYAHSYLDLGSTVDLPFLERVTCLVVSGQGPRYISPSSAFSLLRFLPQVSDVTLQLYDDERKDQDLRKKLRHEFAQALCNGECKNLKRFKLEYQHEGPADHRFKSADMRVLRDGTLCDPFSVGLNHFLFSCPQISELQLGGPMCFDESLFWPAVVHYETARWLSLKNLLCRHELG